MNVDSKGVVFTPTAENATGKKRIFRHQLSEIHVGLGSSALGSLFYRGAVGDKPSGGDFGSYFADELGELSLSNNVPDFKEFRIEIVDLVLSRPLLVHHRTKVAKALASRIVHGATSLQAFAKLSYHLCKDLGKQFLPFVEDLGTALIKSLTCGKNLLVRDTTLIKTVFLVMTGWLKILSPLVDSKNELLTILKPLIAALSHKSSGISRLAGEAMSVAVRKVTEKATLAAVIQACLDVAKPHVEVVETSNFKSDAAAMDRAVAGVSSLLFECIKGVGGKWHSRFDFFLSVISSQLSPDSNLLHVATNGMMVNASKHATPASGLELIDAIASLASTSLKAMERERTAALLSYITQISRKQKLTGPETVKYIKTFVEANTAKMVSIAKASTGDDHNQSIPTCLQAVTEFVLAFAKHTTLATPLKAVMGEVIKIDVPVEVLCESIVGLASFPAFASSLRSSAVDAVQSKCETFTSGTEQKLLLLIISLYEETQESLSPACANVVMHALNTDQPQSVKWLAWKLASLLPASAASKVKPAALKLVKSGESVIISSFALKLLHAIKAKETAELTAATMIANPLSPSIAMAGAAIFSDYTPPKELRETCLAQLRSGKPNVRLCGGKILSNMVGEEGLSLKMINAAEKGEKLRADDLAENRDKVLAFDVIVSSLRHRGPTVEEMELGASILLGALNIRFRPLWSKAQEGLQVVAEKDMGLFWPIFTKQLNSYQEGRNVKRRPRKQRGRHHENDDDEDEDNESDGEDAASDAEGSENGNADDMEIDEEETEAAASIDSLWITAQQEESSNHDATTVQSQFSNLWSLIEKLPASLISNCCEAIFNEYEKQCSADADIVLNKDSIITAFLKVLTQQTNPDSLSIAKRYKDNLWGLLTYSNVAIQKLAITGLKHFKEMQKLGKYEDKLCSLLPHKGLKNSLLNFDFESVRAENVQLAVYKILRPKVWQNTHHTRSQVLSFICGANEVQFSRFMQHIVIPIVESNSSFNKRASKILEFLSSVVDGLGSRLEGWLDRICECVIAHLEGSYKVTGKVSRAHREARRQSLKLFGKVFKQFPEHKYTDDLIDNLTRILKEPIADLGNAASTMGSLLSFLAVLAEDESLLPILKSLNALLPLTETLGQKNISLEVYCNVLSILDSVIEINPSMFMECSAAFVKGVHIATMQTFKGDNKAFAATVSTLNATSEYLLTYADEHKDGAEILNKLMSFLVDCLRNRKLRPTHEAVTTCTNVLCSILPKLPNINHMELVSRLSLLFYIIRTDAARYKIAVAMSRIVDSAPDLPQDVSSFLKATCKLVCATNTLLPNGREYDFDTRISAFYKCTEHFEAWGKRRRKAKATEGDNKEDQDEDMDVEENEVETAQGVTVTEGNSDIASLSFGSMQLADLRPLHILPLAYNLAYFVANSHQSIRTTAALALKAVIVALKRCQAKQGKKELYEQVICPVVTHGVRVGVRLNDPLVRSEWMKVYGCAALAFSITPGLSNVNTDFDFYANITHPQASRKLKALATFRQSSKDVAESTMEAVFIPYFLKLLQTWCGQKSNEDEDMTQSESGKIQAQSQALLTTFAHVSTHLTWTRYHRLVMMLLRQEVTSIHMEKSITKCIGQVLESFHFLPTQEIKPVQDEDEDDEQNEKEDGKPGKENQGLARIGDILVEKIIPAVHRFWKGGNKKEDGEEKLSLTRAPLAVTILNLLKFIPSDVDFGGVVDSILTDMVSKLKTKKAPQRDAVREVLGDALGVLGPSFLKKILHLLRATMLHGYQLHVLGYTMVTMLQRVMKCEGPITVHIDGALGVILDTLLDDYIGVGGSEKEVEELAKTMKEYKKNRSLEGLELVASTATPTTFLDELVGRIQKMFTPTEKLKKEYRPEEKRFKKRKTRDDDDDDDVDVVDTSTGLDLITKVKTMLRRCARGVCANKASDVEDLVSYSASTMQSNTSHRDTFLEKFELKMNAMKVRLTSSSLTEKISSIREAQKKDHEVLNEPERRDRGFEKREVTSQKRQLGSARRKSVKESKRRIVIPGAAARRTLQSMECIDELVVSIAWNLVNHAEEKGTVEKVSKLIEPLIEVMGGDASDSVVTLSLLVLHEVLKSLSVTTTTETVENLMELAFKVVERTGEIRSACFRLMAVLLLHRQAELNQNDAMICCSLVRTDLDKKNTFVIPALHLLKAIIVRKVEVAEVYDLVPVVQEKMLHHSASIIVSQLSASIIARFLTDWKMTEKKLNSHIDYVIQNLQYPVPQGRLAMLGLLEIMFQRFPDALLKKEVEYFFIPLAHRLMADDDRAVKRRAAGVLSKLFKLSEGKLDNVMKIFTSWLDGEPALQITALQSLCVFLKEAPELSGPKLSNFFPDALLDLTTPASLEENISSVGARRRKMFKLHKQNWEIPYHASIALEAVLNHHKEAVKDDVFERLWENVYGNLTHSHPWVRTASSRIFGNEVVQEANIKRGKLVNASRAFVQQINDLGKTAKQSEEDIINGTGSDLETDIDTSIITMAIKNLSWLLPRVMNHQDATKGAKDVAGIWREIKEAAFAGQPSSLSTFKTMTPQTFFKIFGTVRSGAIVKLVGVLLVKMNKNDKRIAVVETPQAKKKASGSRARKALKKSQPDTTEEAADLADETEPTSDQENDEVDEDPIFEQVKGLITFIHACWNIPVTGSPLKKVAKEVMDVLKETLTSQRFVKLFHKEGLRWKALNSKKAAAKSFRSAAKGRSIVKTAPKKESKLLPTTDGSSAKPGSRKRAFSGAPSGDRKKRVVRKPRK
eukprot:TRINITY_DN2326_c0_g1_i1.p1 TRINITY_DN2326_c0_g1~~TRINITY_DN2326_c0_g1_i1.p1  ORF type:complete len:2760 (+),score=826.19 TRINITY_DN2326_c0_g1_i1:77-8356(+)